MSSSHVLKGSYIPPYPWPDTAVLHVKTPLVKDQENSMGSVSVHVVVYEAELAFQTQGSCKEVWAPAKPPDPMIFKVRAKGTLHHKGSAVDHDDHHILCK